MRPLLVIVIWVSLLGGLWGYMRLRDQFKPQPHNVVEIQPAPGSYSVELTPTFDAQGGVDDFALNPVEQPSIVLALNGTEIATYQQTAAAGIPVEFTWNIAQAPLEMGKNEFRIKMNTPDVDVDAVRGVRLRLLRDGAEVTDQTLWSEPGKPVDGVVRVEINVAVDSDEHGHQT